MIVGLVIFGVGLVFRKRSPLRISITILAILAAIWLGLANREPIVLLAKFWRDGTWMPAEILLKVEPDVVVLGDTAKVLITVNGKGLEPGQNVECYADNEPTSFYQGHKDSVDFSARVKDYGARLARSGLIRVPIRVVVRGAHERKVGEDGSTEVEITGLFPSINSSTNNLMLGGTAKLQAMLNDDPVDADKYRCLWESIKGIVNRSKTAEGPEVTYTAPDTIGETKSDDNTSAATRRTTDTVTLTVRTVTGEELGSATQQIVIKTPPEFSYVFVIDSCARMAAPVAGATNLTMMEALKGQFVDNLKDVEATGGYLMIQVFGWDPFKRATQCEDTISLINLAPAHVEKAREGVMALSPGRPDAPLLESIWQALNQFHESPRDPTGLRLIVLTAGPDNCQKANSDFADYLETLAKEMLAVKGVGEIWVKNELLLMTISIEFNTGSKPTVPSERFRNEYKEHPHLFYHAKSEKGLGRVLKNISQLDPRDPKRLNEAAQDLESAFREAEDTLGAERIAAYQRSLQ